MAGGWALAVWQPRRSLSPARLQAQAPPTAVHFSAWFLKFIGICEVLGGLGLVLPGLTRVRKGLTVFAALGLAIIMIGAVVTGIMGEGVKAAIVPFVTGLLCVFIAYGRRDWLTAK